MCSCVEFGRLGCTCIILSSGADCRFGSSMIQNGRQLIFAHPPTLIGLGLRWSSLVLLGLRVYATTSRRGSDPLSAGGYPFPRSDMSERWEPFTSCRFLEVLPKHYPRVSGLPSKERTLSSCVSEARKSESRAVSV